VDERRGEEGGRRKGKAGTHFLQKMAEEEKSASQKGGLSRDSREPSTSAGSLPREKKAGLVERQILKAKGGTREAELDVGPRARKSPRPNVPEEKGCFRGEKGSRRTRSRKRSLLRSTSDFLIAIWLGVA